LSLLHIRPLEVDFIFMVEHCKSYLPLPWAFASIEWLLRTSNPILECLRVEAAIVDRWVVTSESLKHMGDVLLSLFDLHYFLQVFMLPL